MRIVEDGTRAVIHRSGMPVKTWPWAGKYFCMEHNFTSIGDKPSAWERRFEKEKKGPFPGQRAACGQRIDFLPPEPVV